MDTKYTEVQFWVYGKWVNKESTDQEDENVKNDGVEKDDGPRQLVAHNETTLDATTLQTT